MMKHVVLQISLNHMISTVGPSLISVKIILQNCADRQIVELNHIFARIETYGHCEQYDVVIMLQKKNTFFSKIHLRHFNMVQGNPVKNSYVSWPGSWPRLQDLSKMQPKIPRCNSG